MTTTAIAYQPEVDGLRAVAVLPVVLFHAGLGAISGGFLGVDVFFVISGYLITSILLRQLTENRFSLLNFYERRARRILPALFVVVFVSFPAAYVLMPPEQFASFVQSIGAVSIFLSNFFFWQEFDYFSVGSELLPMVHTWSLGVEEQFYLLFPIFLWLCFRYIARATLAVLAIVAVASLGVTEFYRHDHGMATFYLLPFRAWELLLGSCGAFLRPSFDHLTRGVREPLSAIGLIMLIASLALMTEETPTPSAYTLIPTAGALFVILFAGQDTLAGRALALPALVWLGQASYSIYLWHQPVFAFARLGGFTLDSLVQVLLLIGLVVLLAAVTLRFVERPFRNLSFLGSGSVAALAVSAGVAVLAIAGYGRFNGFDDWFYSEEGTAFLKTYQGRTRVYPELYREDCNYYLSRELAPRCLTSPAPALPTTLVWGDSHAQGLAVGLRELYGDRRFFAQVGTSACRPALVDQDPSSMEPYPVNAKAFGAACLKANATATRFIREHEVESIVFHAYSNFDQVPWAQLLEETERLGIPRVFIVAPMPQWDPSLPTVHALRLGSAFPKPLVTFLRERPFVDTDYVEALETDERVRKVFPVKKLCRSRTHCETVVPGKSAMDPDALFAFDYGHLTYAGSLYIAQTLFDQHFAE